MAVPVVSGGFARKLRFVSPHKVIEKIRVEFHFCQILFCQINFLKMPFPMCFCSKVTIFEST